jgi:hypothetical protein
MKIENEIDAIRDAIYEKIKNMQPSEITAYFKKTTESTIREYGIKTASTAHEVTRVRR